MDLRLANEYPRLPFYAMTDAHSQATADAETGVAAAASSPGLGRHVVLVGFMATGKTTVGRACARVGRMRFIDTDAEVERTAGKRIPAIFESEGEAAFRKKETAVLRGLREAKGPQVIATGGGIVTIEENIPLLRQLGFVVWLDADQDDIVRRAARKRNRPLLRTENPAATVAKLLEKRRPLYKRAADLKITTTGLTLDEVVTGVLESARYHFSCASRSGAGAVGTEGEGG